MRIAVAILTHNRAVQLAEALTSVQVQTRPPDEIVVVDSASSDNTCAMLRNHFPAVRLVRLHRNLGCPEGRNIAMANCTADVVYSLDDDARIHRRCLEIAEKAFTEHNRAGIVASKILTDQDPSPQQIKAQLAKMPRRTIRFSGGACGIRREVLEQAGYYPHDFWRQSEETDLALRVTDAGFEIWYAPAAIVFHQSRVSEKKSSGYYSTLNTLRSAIRLVPARYVPLVLVHQGAKHIVEGVRHREVAAICKAYLRWIIILPILFRQRHPVRMASMQSYLKLRREYKRRPSINHGNI